MLLKHVLCVSAEYLVERYDERACGVLLAVLLEGAFGAINFDATDAQLVYEFNSFRGIVLGGERNNCGEVFVLAASDGALLALFNGALVDAVNLMQKRFAAVSR